MASLKVVNANKIYQNGTQAVKDFSLNVSDDEFIVLVGPSGCGKSTMLRMIAGLEEITDGEIYIGDLLVNDLPAKERDISMVFQNHALYPHFTVYENLAFPLKIKKEKKDAMREKVIEMAETLGITGLLERKPNMISGGECQRVAIGRALIRKPKVFLMDEPLSNLDAKLRLQMREEIIRIREKFKTTFIYVTHDQIEAMALGDRIVVMDRGVIQQIGTPNEIYNNPNNAFVASFIGSPPMNFIEGNLLHIDNTMVLELGVFRYNIEKKHLAATNHDKMHAVLIGIRPGDLQFGESDIMIECRYEYSETLGDEVHFHFRLMEEPLIMKTPTAKAYMRNDTLSAGQSVALGIDFQSLYLFDAQTGKRLDI